MNKFLIVFLILIVGVVVYGIRQDIGVGGSFSGSGVSNSSVTVGSDASLSATVLSVNSDRYYAKICNNGIGNVTLCYATTCSFDSGIKLATTAGEICHEIKYPNVYKGAITAAVTATTSASTKATLGVIER